TLIITVVSCLLFSHLISPYCSPLAVLPIILSIMIGGRTGFMGLVVTISTLLLSYSVMDYGMVGVLSDTFYEITISLIVSMIRVLLILFLIHRNYSRFKLMWGAAAINLVASLPIILLAMIVDTDIEYLLLSYTYSILGGFIAIIIFSALIPLYEQLFNVWTNFKLAEICSLSRPLLRRLSNEAPGTFNHCIIVSNLAEACAIAVGENPYLAKACGIYHDIGKLSAPEFFTENQQGYNPHDDLIPSHSAKMIISHTKIGYDMLKKAHLPDEIAKVALEHHGTTTVKYFHNKAKQLTEGTVNDKLYMYDGPRPTSKISAIVMISDVVEAITRSRNTANMDELKAIVENVIKEKINDHQFDNSDITFSDLEKISVAISKVVPGVY
ncbi:MAG: HDIG domain-containing protein, partial [Clostridia bacterium]|nr:HDIG domain-containing protein [Clostridia bacterium]